MAVASDPDTTSTAQAMRALLPDGRDRAAVLARFVTGLSPDDPRLPHQLGRGARPSQGPGR